MIEEKPSSDMNYNSKSQLQQEFYILQDKTCRGGGGYSCLYDIVNRC
jgi:hypothetical protein